MLTRKRIKADSAELGHIEALYRASFPENERRPLEPLLEDTTGHGEVLAFYDGSLFCGFACLLNCGDLSHIIYFAVEESLRGKGYGSAALEAMHAEKRGQRIIVDIERENPRAANEAQREKRRRFYLKNGYRATEVRYSWRQEEYEILSFGGAVTRPDFEHFWDELYNRYNFAGY